MFSIQTFFTSPPSPFLLLFFFFYCYIIAEWFFLYYHFSLVISYHSVWLGLELFGLVHVQVHTLRAEDMTITYVIIKTPDRNETGVWITSCPEAMGWEFWWFLKKAVSWDLNLGEASWFLSLGEASWGLRDAPWFCWVRWNGQHSQNCVSLSPRVERLNSRSQ